MAEQPVKAPVRCVGGPAPWLLVLCSSLCAIGGCSRFAPERERQTGALALGGVLDLGAWDFRKQGDARLAGEWWFYRGRLLAQEEADHRTPSSLRVVPDFWRGADAGGLEGRGAGTYRLRVLLPQGHPDLAIRNLTVTTSFEMEVDGVLVARGGKPATVPRDAVAAYNPGVTRIQPHSDTLDIIVRVSNHEYRAGGIWRTFVLGPADRLEAARRTGVYGALILTAAVWAIALNSICIFLFRRKERSYLHFGLLALAIGFRPMVTGEYALVGIFPAIPFSLLVRLEYATAFFSLPTAVLFFLSLFGQDHKRSWTLGLTLPFAPFVLFELFAPLPFLTRSIFWFYIVALAVIIVAAVFILARAAYRGKPGGRILLVGGVVLALAGINDMLYSAFIVPTGAYLPYAVAFFICLQAAVLARRFTAAFDKTEVLSVELARSNQQLQAEFERVTDARGRLEQLLREKEVLLQEVHHRVKNSLQIVSSIVALQSYRTPDPASQALARSIRDRIRAISVAHEQLYNLASADLIDAGTYVRELVRLNVSGFGMEQQAVRVEVRADSVRAAADFAIDIGLILTELLANTFEHSLLPRRGGALEVELRQIDGAITLAVCDDGPGFAPGFQTDRAETSGFRIVSTLLHKREGSIVVTPGPSPRVVCRFPTGPWSPPSA